MLIALLALLGVDLVVIVVLVVLILARRRWVAHQPGAFRGAIRVTDRNVEDLPPRWWHGYGRWVRDVLVWTKAPLLLRNELIAVDSAEQRATDVAEVKRLGEHPVVVRLAAGTAIAEVAAHVEDTELIHGPFRTPDDTPTTPPVISGAWGTARSNAPPHGSGQADVARQAMGDLSLRARNVMSRDMVHLFRDILLFSGA
jgi:hypothetical protein